MERSPYSAFGTELIADLFASALGYASIRQDMRGTGSSSTSNFSCWHDSANDSYDTISWIVNQSWSNGEVFTVGISADAIDEIATIANPHPALRGQVAIWGTSDGYGTFYPGGTYREALIDGWLGFTIPTEYKDLDALVRSKEQPDTDWWRPVNGTVSGHTRTVEWIDSLTILTGEG